MGLPSIVRTNKNRKACDGEEKVRRIKRWIKENQIDTNLYKIAYSDSFHDLPLLEFADLPTAVNPDKKLKEISSNRGWKIIERSR